MKINSINNQYQYNTRKIQNDNSAKNQYTPSFNGKINDTIIKPLTNAAAVPLSGLYSKAASKTPFQKFVYKFSRTNSFRTLMFVDSCLLSGFYMFNTARNKKIKKEQKPQMLINDALTLGFSSVGAFCLDGLVSKGVEKLTDNHFKNNQKFYIDKAKELAENIEKKNGIINDICSAAVDATENGINDVTAKIGAHLKGIVTEKGKEAKAFQISPEKLAEIQNGVADAIRSNRGNAEAVKNTATGLLDDVYDKMAGKLEADKIIPGFTKLKTLVAFGLIYRYAGPVIVTPLANKLSSKFFNKEKSEGTKTQDKK